MKTSHDHVHGACEHPAVRHGDHIDYLHDGQLHAAHDALGGDHHVAVDNTNPQGCTDGHTCTSHERAHVHGESCGHALVPHGDHTDYLVNGHLHHPHAGHCDDHGELAAV